MKKSIIVIIIVLLLVLVGIGALSYFGYNKENILNLEDENNINNNLDSTVENNVNIENFRFSPSIININAGDKITWVNQDSALHTVTSDNGNELNSNSLSDGESYSHTFNIPGEYNYHCDIHPEMTGKVIVS